MVDPKIEQVVTDEEITHISFNQEQDAFAVGTTNGFWIFSIEPFQMRIRRVFEGGVRVVQMVGKSNLILLIPTGEDSRYPANSVLLWDDKRLKHVGVIKFGEDALSVTFASDMFMVSQSSVLTCLTMKDVAVFSKIETCHNPRGLQAVSYGNDFCIATPHKEPGKLQLTWLSRLDQSGCSELS